MAVARVPTIMPHVSSSGGGDDLGSEDEVKVFKDEGEEEKRSSENLTEDKSDLIDLTESEVRIHFSVVPPTYFPCSPLCFVFRVSRFDIFFIHPPKYFCSRRTRSIKCVHVCCRKRARSPVGPMRRREKRRRDPTTVPFSVSLLSIFHEILTYSAFYRTVTVFCPCPRENVKKVVTVDRFRRGEFNSRYFANDAGNHIDANFARVA